MALGSSAGSCSWLWQFFGGMYIIVLRCEDGLTNAFLQHDVATRRRTLSHVVEVDLVHVGIRTLMQPLVVIVPLCAVEQLVPGTYSHLQPARCFNVPFIPQLLVRRLGVLVEHGKMGSGGDITT